MEWYYIVLLCVISFILGMYVFDKIQYFLFKMYLKIGDK
jgi:hypothetical protein